MHLILTFDQKGFLISKNWDHFVENTDILCMYNFLLIIINLLKSFQTELLSVLVWARLESLVGDESVQIYQAHRPRALKVTAERQAAFSGSFPAFLCSGCVHAKVLSHTLLPSGFLSSVLTEMAINKDK